MGCVPFPYVAWLITYFSFNEIFHNANVSQLAINSETLMVHTLWYTCCMKAQTHALLRMDNCTRSFHSEPSLHYFHWVELIFSSMWNVVIVAPSWKINQLWMLCPKQVCEFGYQTLLQWSTFNSNSNVDQYLDTFLSLLNLEL